MKRLSLMSALLLTGCAALAPQKPIIESRYRTATSVVPDPARSVKISVSTRESEAQGGAVSIKELSDRGQAALIEQHKGSPPTQLKGQAKGGGATVLQNTIKRRLVVTMLPINFLPDGDRLDAVSVSLKINEGVPGDWTISDWSLASDGEVFIDVGKLTGVSASKVSAETGLKVADFLPDFKISGERSTSRTEEYQVKDPISFDAAVDTDGTAWLVKRAGWRTNLAHNLSIDVTAVAPELEAQPIGANSVSSLIQEAGPSKGQLTPPNGVRLREITIYKPLSGQTLGICGLATLHYRIRHITRGQATFSESDDDVEFSEDSTSAPFLFSPPPLDPLYVIRVDGRVMEYQIGNSRPSTLHFGSVEEATAFRDWLRQVEIVDGKLGNAKIGVAEYGPFRPLQSKRVNDLIVEPANRELIREAEAFDPRSCEGKAAPKT